MRGGPTSWPVPPVAPLVSGPFPARQLRPPPARRAVFARRRLLRQRRCSSLRTEDNPMSPAAWRPWRGACCGPSRRRRRRSSPPSTSPSRRPSCRRGGELRLPPPTGSFWGARPEARWRDSAAFRWAIRRILWARSKMLSHHGLRFKQFSVLSSCRLSLTLPGLLGWRPAPCRCPAKRGKSIRVRGARGGDGMPSQTPSFCPSGEGVAAGRRPSWGLSDRNRHRHPGGGPPRRRPRDTPRGEDLPGKGLPVAPPGAPPRQPERRSWFRAEREQAGARLWVPPPS